MTETAFRPFKQVSPTGGLAHFPTHLKHIHPFEVFGLVHSDHQSFFAYCEDEIYTRKEQSTVQKFFFAIIHIFIQAHNQVLLSNRMIHMLMGEIMIDLI